MAMEYEVREEYRSHSLSQLMDDAVLCFQGVGEIQAELLKQYFGIGSVKDLANWKQFLWALEIQELALHGGDLANTPIRELSKTGEPKFKVKERVLHLTPQELMHGSVQDLEDLTPAQDLALYDIFRITNIAQLAHNRIMLEARVIQYLEGQARESGQADPGADGVDSVMGRGTSALAAAAAQRITESRKTNRDERLHAMANETREHVRERLGAVRDRARGRAAAMAGGQTDRATVIAHGAEASSSTHRLEAIRATRQRADSAMAASTQQRTLSPERMTAIAGRRTTVAASAGHERGAFDEARTVRGTSAGGVLANRGAAASRTATGTMSSRAASVLAARGGGASARYTGTGGATYSGRGGGGGGGGGTMAAATRTATTTTTTTATKTTATATSAAVASAAVPPSETRTLATERRGPPPAVWLAVAGVIIVAAIAYFALRGNQPAPGTATTGAPTQQAGTATQPSGVAQPGGAAQTGAVTGSAGTQTTGATSAQPSAAGATKTGTVAGTATGTAGTPGIAKTIHTVREGQSLWRISRRYYSVGHDWPVIYKENQDQIKSPNRIYPKQQLRIPEKP